MHINELLDRMLEEDEEVSMITLDYLMNRMDYLNNALHFVLGEQYNQAKFKEMTAVETEVVVTLQQLKDKQTEVNAESDKYLKLMNEAESDSERKETKEQFTRAYDDLLFLQYLISKSTTGAQGGLTMADIYEEIDKV